MPYLVNAIFKAMHRVCEVAELFGSQTHEHMNAATLPLFAEMRSARRGETRLVLKRPYQTRRIHITRLIHRAHVTERGSWLSRNCTTARLLDELKRLFHLHGRARRGSLPV